MANPHPFTKIKEGDLVAITGWAPEPGLNGTAISFRIHGYTEEEYLTADGAYYFSLTHGETVIGFVVRKLKSKRKEFMHILIKDTIVIVERGLVHKSHFAIGKITTNAR